MPNWEEIRVLLYLCTSLLRKEHTPPGESHAALYLRGRQKRGQIKELYLPNNNRRKPSQPEATKPKTKSRNGSLNTNDCMRDENAFPA